MDPGEVVWLPGTGYNGDEENSACYSQYGDEDPSACGDVPWDGGTLVFCC
jgi:hypothetical protein